MSAAVALGGGAIWSMHFIAMIGCRLPVAVAYDELTTIASLFVAIVVTGIGLFIVGRGHGSVPRLVVGGTFTGVGVAAMHYAGMEALRLPARLVYRGDLVAASIVIAVVAATVAFWLAFNLSGMWQRVTASVVMGIAVCGMHYTGMAAVTFVPTRTVSALRTAAWKPSELGFIVFGITLCVLVLLSAGSSVIESRRKREDIVRTRAELERQVAERTAELAMVVKSLRMSEASTRAMIDNMLTGLITTDERSIIESVNPAAQEMLGYSAEEIVGLNLSILLAPEDAEDAAGFLKTAHRKSIGRVSEWPVRRKDGSLFAMELALFEFQTPDGRRHFAGSIRDVSEMREVERLKGEFISTVSHELRTPLTSIRGSLGLINGGVAGVIPPEAKALLDIAYKNTERLSRLVNDILDLEKIESGRMEFEVERFEAAPFLESVLESNESYAATYGVRLAIEQEAKGVWIRADRDRFAQVMANLISNAVKFSPREGCVTISVSRDEGSAIISVTDRGPGIPEEFRGRIFQRFQQADSSDTRQKGGTGLGLAITKSIVERLGGEISFESIVGAGTTFRVRIPEQWATESAGLEAVVPRHVRARILICEQDVLQANLLSQILQKAGCQTEVARDAAEAKALLAHGHFDAMTLDIVLPGQDGVSLIHELRTDEKTRDLPIVVVALDTDSGRARLAGNAIGMIDWLAKPVDPKRLLHAIARAARRLPDSVPRILHVEDDPDTVTLLAALVGKRAEIVAAQSCREAQRILSESDFDLIVLDLELPDGSGLDLLPLLHLRRPVPVLVFSAQELSLSVRSEIEAALTKSHTSNEEILSTIESLINLPRAANS